eukprot:CAMPEP_0170424024 /NCGR_PEP_ID=MMETSP0117_2-20130122/37326_1 /TAXON_ID=400756 /ORGANISM="Durinskia baltica, Strain CSIRO CS-38" /LENGTH=101 /DNA_ID=CAMNT_0010682843 /DNA_START=51 /DNA_END=353 /DNA_ORIENTATION=+
MTRGCAPPLAASVAALPVVEELRALSDAGVAYVVRCGSTSPLNVSTRVPVAPRMPICSATCCASSVTVALLVVRTSWPSVIPSGKQRTVHWSASRAMARCR